MVMKKLANRIKIIGMILVIVSCTIFSDMTVIEVDASGTFTSSEVEAKLNTLMTQFPAGSSWTQSFAGGTQCYAFAHYIFNTIFNRGSAQVGNGASSSNTTCYKLNNVASDIIVVGSLTPGYSASSLEQLLESARPGDYIQVKRKSSGGPHSMIVTGVDANANTISIFDANAVASNTVGQYTQTFSYFMQRNAGVTVYRYKYYSTGSNPEGNIESVTGGVGCITVSGWAFDRDAVSEALDIHVYIGGTADSGAPCYFIKADKARADVNVAFAVGNYHGYNDTISTDRTGQQEVYIYAVNKGGGSNVFLGKRTVTIEKATPQFTVDNISDGSVLSGTSARVVGKVTNGGTYPWLELYIDYGYVLTTCNNGEGDYAFYLDTTKYQNGEHLLGVKLRNQDGFDYTIWRKIIIDNDKEQPTISDISVQKKTDGYIITCKVEDNCGVERVTFPTWTALNGQDDLVEYKGTLSGGKAEIYVKRSNHNNEYGTYITHIYAYDINGNCTGKEVIVTLEETVNVSGVTLNKTSSTMTQKGETLALTATVSPSNATNKKITWSSSNTSVATVSSSGVVTAVANGTAIINVKTADGSKTATCKVTVNIPVSVTGVTLNKTSSTMTKKGETLSLAATVSPTNATNKNVTWSSSNTSVATVSSSGVVTAVANGTTTITVKTADGSKTATCKVTVSIPTAITGGKISAAAVSGYTGDIVAVPITIEKNPGIIAAQYKLSYDATKLKLIEIKDAGLLETPFMSDNYSNNPYILSWGDGLLKENNTKTGKAATAYFKILDSASAGTTAITLTTDEVYDKNLKEVNFTTVNGSIEIMKCVPGDVNGDGEAKLNDAILLRRYISGEAVEIDLKAADVNGDGYVKLDDAVLLRRYMAGWNVTIK